MKRYIYHSLSKLLITIIIFLTMLIYVNKSGDNKKKIFNNIYTKNISFAKINKIYKTYLGNIIPVNNIIPEITPVFNEKLTYNESNLYKEGISLTVENNYLIPIINNGIVIYIGEKEEYGKTVIIQQDDGTDIWYSNLSDINVELYNYVKTGELLGTTLNNKLYLIFKKEGKIVDYKEYL